jgi:hypothetical protein
MWRSVVMGVARFWPGAALCAGVVLAWVGLSGPAAPAERADPAIAVLLPAPGPAGLELLGLLERLRRPNPPGMQWLGGDLIEVPGAADHQLWLRAVSGRINPDADAVNLFERAGIAIYGNWDDSADAVQDKELLEQARRHLEGGAHRSPGAVVLLSCSKVVTDLLGGACRETFLEAVRLLEDAARAGGTGLLLAVPVRGFPQVGTVWAVGPSVQEGVDFRFRMIDLGPTMLRLLGEAVPPVLDGGPSYDLTRFEHLFHRPLRWEGGGT